MAIKVGDAFVSIGANTLGLDAALAGISGKMATMGASIASAGKTMMLGVTAPLAIIGGLSLKTAADYSEAMANVKAVTGATADEFKLLDKAAKDLGASTRYSAVQVADAMKFMGMTGMDTNTILESINDTLTLAAAGNLEMGTAADIVTNIMAGFNMEAADLGQTVDILTTAFTSSNVDLQMLGESMKYAGPVANAYGMELAETAAIMGTLGNAGIQGSMAGTTLRQILLKLTDVTAELGVEMYDAQGNMRPVVDILADIEATGTSTTKIIDMFGARAGPGVAVLLEQGIDSLKDFASELENSGGAAQKVADTQMEGIHGQIIKLKSAFEGLRISVGEALIPIITPLIEKMTGLFRAFTNLDPKIQKIIVALAAVAAVVGPVMFVVGKLMVLLAPLANIIGILIGGGGIAGLTAAFPTLGATITLLLGPIGLIVLAIAGIGVAFVLAYKKSEKFRKIVNTVIEKVKGFFSSLYDKVRFTMDAIFAKTMEVWEYIKPYLAAALDYIWSVAEPVLNSLYELFSVIWGKIQGVVEVASTVIVAIIGRFIEVASRLWSRYGEDILSVASAVWDGIKIVIETALDIIKLTIETVTAIINGDWDKAWENIKEIARTAFNGIKSIITSAVPAILSAVYNLGVNIAKGIINGIGDLGGKIWNAVKGGLSSVTGKIKGFFGISSPSKVMYAMGRNISQGLINGIKSLDPQVTASYGNLMRETPNIGVAASPILPQGVSSNNVEVTISPSINVNRKLSQSEIDTMMNSWVSAADKSLKRKGIFFSG